MARTNNADFNQGYNPLTEAARLNESRILKPTVETPISNDGSPLPDSKPKVSSSAESANTLEMLKEANNGKRVIGMNDAITHTKTLYTQLQTAKNSAVRTIRNPDFASMQQHLDDAQQHLALVQHHKASATSLAWEHLEKAGNSLNNAHKIFSSIHPDAAADIKSVHHFGQGVSLDILPGEALSHITEDPSPFRYKGKKPKYVNTSQGILPAADIEQGLKEIQENIKEGSNPGRTAGREDLRRKVSRQLQGTRRVRKPSRPVGPVDIRPLKIAEVSPMGEPAVQSRTGDWSGAEASRGNPESAINKVDRENESKGGNK